MSTSSASLSPSPLPPADETIHICSLPDPKPEPVSEPEPAADLRLGSATKGKSPAKESKRSRRRSRGVQLRSPNSDGEKTTAGSRILPATLRGPMKAEKGKALKGKYASCSSNQDPLKMDNLLDALKLLSKPLDKKFAEMNLLEIIAMKGIHFDPPRWHRPGGYDAKPKETK